MDNSRIALVYWRDSNSSLLLSVDGKPHDHGPLFLGDDVLEFLPGRHSVAVKWVDSHYKGWEKYDASDRYRQREVDQVTYSHHAHIDAEAGFSYWMDSEKFSGELCVFGAPHRPKGTEQTTENKFLPQSPSAVLLNCFKAKEIRRTTVKERELNPKYEEKKPEKKEERKNTKSLADQVRSR